MVVRASTQEQATDSYIRQRAMQLQEQARQQEAAAAAAAAQEAARGRTWGEAGRDTALGLSQGLGGLAAAAYGAVNIPLGALSAATGGFIPTPEQMSGGQGSQFFRDFNQAMEEGKSAPLQARKAAQDAAFDRGIGAGILETVTSGPLLGDLAAQALPSLIPGTVAARAGGVAGRADAASRGLPAAAQAAQAGRAARRAATITTGVQVGGNTYTDVVNAAREDGASEGDANLRALGASALAGIGSAAIMKLTGAGALEAGLARVTSGAPATGGVIRATATGAGREAGEETAQSALEQEAQNIFVESRELGQDTGKAAALGGIAGGILGGGVGGLSRALNGGQPSLSREEMAAQKAAVDAELNGVLRPSILGGTAQEGSNAAELQAAQQRAELASAVPTVTPTTDEDMAILRQAFGDEEINLDEAGLPLAGALPDAQELTGIRRVLAERQIQRAQQPPRMDVTELPVEEIELADVPTGNTPSARNAYKRSAPLTGVEQRFGADAAKAEAERRGAENLRDEDVAKYFGLAELAKVQVKRAQATPTAVPGEQAARTPIDISTKQARAKFAGQVRTALRSAVPAADADNVRGAYINAIADLAAAEGIQPGSPEFTAFVARKSYRDMAVANRAGRAKSAEASQAARLSAAYPLSPADADAINAGLDFDAAVEQEAAAPAAEPAPAPEDIESYMTGFVSQQDENASPLAKRIAARVGVPAGIVDGFINRGQIKSGNLDQMVASFNQAYAAYESDINARIASESANVRRGAQGTLRSGEQGVELTEALESLGTAAPTGSQLVRQGTRSANTGIWPAAANTPAEQLLTPATEATTVKRGQTWVDPQGGQHTVNMVPNKNAVVMTGPDGRKRTRQLATLRSEGWAVQAEPAVEGLDVQMLGRLRDTLANTYWQERGGRLLRENGQEGAVTGRTEWLSSVPEVQAVLSNTGYKAADVAALLDRAATGQGRPLTDKQKGLVAGVMGALSDAQGAALTASPELQRALALTEDQYIAQVNPTGSRVAEDDRILLNVGDLAVPAGVTPVESFTDTQGNAVQVVQDAAGVMYAVRGNDVLGMMGPQEDGETVIDVVQQALGQGVGRGLAVAYIRQNPFAQSGGFSPAGEANRRSAFRALKAEYGVAEQTPPVDTPSKAAETRPAQRYDQARWDLYSQYPGATQLNALAQAKAAEGHPQPVYAGMAFAIDLAADITELNQAAFAAKAHPEYDLMSDQLRTDIESRVATAVNRITGAAFNVKPGEVKAPARQDETAAFKRWFGGSKVVDASGNPLVVYHGSAADFDTFDLAYANQDDPDVPVVGFHLSSDVDRARGVRTDQNREFYVSIKNPATVTQAYQTRLRLVETLGRQPTNQEVTNKLVAEGFDGVFMSQPWAFSQADIDRTGRSLTNPGADNGYELVFEGGEYSLYSRGNLSSTFESVEEANETGSEFHVVAFRPQQIKSAVGNVGTFDPTNPDIRFNQGGTSGASIPKTVFDNTVAAAAQTLGIDIRAHEDAPALTEAVGHAVPSNVKGMYAADGVVHVVRANHTSKKDLAFTIAHERGHKGLAQLLGPNLRAATNRMWANAEMRKRIKAKMADLNYAQDTEEARRASRTLAAEEVLADMLAAGERLNNGIVAKLRSGVRNFFATVLGYRDMTVTNAEVDRLLQDVAQVLNGQPAQNVAAGGADADLWLNNPERAADNNAKFNVAKADLDKLIDAAQQETTAKIAPFSDITKAAGVASIDAARSVGEKLKGNSLGELYTNNAMHLSQLEGWYDRLFQGRIGKLAAVKRAKEAFFNQMNSRPIDLKYDGKDVGKQSVNDIAKEWSNYGRQNPQKMQALNAMTSFGSFYKVFPDRAWDQQNDIDYDAAGFTVEQREAAHRQMRGLWNAVGKDGQAIYKKAQAVYAHRWNQRFETLLAELDRIGKSYTVDRPAPDGSVDTITRYKNDVRLAMQRVSEGPYSPLQRNGAFIVTARDGDGDVVHFSAYDTKAEAELARKHVRESMERGGESGVVAVTTQKQFDVNINGTSRGTIEQMSNSVKADLLAALPAEMSDADKRQIVSSVSSGLVESYLQALPQNSFMKHARKRKNVEGFSTDAFRAFNDYALRSARDTAGIKFDGQIGNAMTQVQNYAKDVADGKYLPEGDGVREVDATKLQNVANAVQSQHAASLDVNRNALVRTLTQFGFIYYMTSLSQMFLNATQTYMVAFPRLAAQYGAGMAAKELNKAVGQYFKSGFDLLGANSKIDDPRVKDALQSLYESGTLDFTQAHDLSEMAAGDNETLSPHISAGIRVLSYAMHKSEVFNRQVTATAAIRMELAKRGNPMPRAGSPEAAKLQEEMAEVGRKAVDTTHFDYSQSNKPPIMQSNLGALALQFQQYRFHMLSMIGKDIRDGFFGETPEIKSESRKALSWLLGMQLAFTGAAGTVLAPVVFAIADAFKDDDDLTDSRQDFINHFGKYVSHGVLAGVIDTQRIGADTLVPILGERAYEPITDRQSDILMYHIQQNLGPAVGLAGDAFDGVSHMLNGDVYKASQELLPKPFKDAVKAVYEGTSGAADARGIVYYQPSLLSGLSQFVGLRSGARRDAEATRGAAFKANARYYAAKGRNLNRLAISHSMGDNAAIAQAEEDIAAFNEKYPDLAIRGPERRQAVVNRFRSEQVAAESGIVSGRPLRDSILAATGQ